MKTTADSEGIKTQPKPASAAPDPVAAAHVKRHLQFGWWSLLVFLSLGIILEAFHGFKAGLYLDVTNETRRLMWTLAHAHGTLLALVHIAFAFSITVLPKWDPAARRLGSSCLVGASVLMPGGFFLGGAVIYSGDPGLGILLVPIGALLLFIAVLSAARAVGAPTPESGKSKR